MFERIFPASKIGRRASDPRCKPCLPDRRSQRRETTRARRCRVARRGIEIGGSDADPRGRRSELTRPRRRMSGRRRKSSDGTPTTTEALADGIGFSAVSFASSGPCSWSSKTPRRCHRELSLRSRAREFGRPWLPPALRRVSTSSSLVRARVEALPGELQRGVLRIDVRSSRWRALARAAIAHVVPCDLRRRD